MCGLGSLPKFMRNYVNINAIEYPTFWQRPTPQLAAVVMQNLRITDSTNANEVDVTPLTMIMEILDPATGFEKYEGLSGPRCLPALSPIHVLPD